MKIYVDDIRKCPDDFTLAKSYEEAIRLLKDNNVEILSLDHDLGINPDGTLAKTGYDIVKHICENNIKVAKIYLHTDNPVGRENMYQTLIGAQRRGFIDKNIEVYRYSYIKNTY